MSLSVIVDDGALPQSAFTGGRWNHQDSQNSALDNTLSTYRAPGKGTKSSNDDDDEQTPGGLTYSFYGSDIAVYGTLTSGLTMNYSIDGAVPLPAQLTNGTIGKPGAEIFSLADLGKTELHKLQLFPTVGQFVFDYLTTTATAATNITGSELIVDDHDPLVHYSSGWNKMTQMDVPTGSLYLGTGAGTNKKGSSLTYNFIGSSISVIGATQKVNGSLSVSFTVDGQTPVKFSPFDGSQNVNATQWAVSQTFFHQEVASGSHQLEVTLDEVTGAQVLWIDAFVFKGTNATSLTGDMTPAQTESHSSRISGGAIAGIVIGLCAAFILLGIIIWKWRGRGRQRYKKSKVIVDLNDTYSKSEHPAVVMEEIPAMDEFMQARIQAAYRIARQQNQQHHRDPSYDNGNDSDNGYAPPIEETSALPHNSVYNSPQGAHFPTPNPSMPARGTFAGASQEKALRNDRILQWPQPTVRNQSDDITPSIAHEIAATAALLAPAIAPVTQTHDIPPSLIPGRAPVNREEHREGNSFHVSTYSFGSSTIPPPSYDFAASKSHK